MRKGIEIGEDRLGVDNLFDRSRPTFNAARRSSGERRMFFMTGSVATSFLSMTDRTLLVSCSTFCYTADQNWRETIAIGTKSERIEIQSRGL